MMGLVICSIYSLLNSPSKLVSSFGEQHQLFVADRLKSDALLGLSLQSLPSPQDRPPCQRAEGTPHRPTWPCRCSQLWHQSWLPCPVRTLHLLWPLTEGEGGGGQMLRSIFQQKHKQPPLNRSWEDAMLRHRWPQHFLLSLQDVEGRWRGGRCDIKAGRASLSSLAISTGIAARGHVLVPNYSIINKRRLHQTASAWII